MHRSKEPVNHCGFWIVDDCSTPSAVDYELTPEDPFPAFRGPNDLPCSVIMPTPRTMSPNSNLSFLNDNSLCVRDPAGCDPARITGVLSENRIDPRMLRSNPRIVPRASDCSSTSDFTPRNSHPDDRSNVTDPVFVNHHEMASPKRDVSPPRRHDRSSSKERNRSLSPEGTSHSSPCDVFIPNSFDLLPKRYFPVHPFNNEDSFRQYHRFGDNSRIVSQLMQPLIIPTLMQTPHLHDADISMEGHVDNVSLRRGRPPRYMAKIVHSPDGGAMEEYICTLCDNSFTSHVQIKQHMKVHLAERPFKCQECPKTFANSSYLAQHSRVHSGVRPYHCLYCPKPFKQLSHLQQHHRTHTGERPYQCSECTKTFTQLSGLQSHTKQHTKEKPYDCVHCFRTYRSQEELMDHMVLHSLSNQTLYRCTLCDNEYTQMADLSRHMTSHNLDDPRPRMCPACNRHFVSQSFLKEHMAECHPRVVPSEHTCHALARANAPIVPMIH